MRYGQAQRRICPRAPRLRRVREALNATGSLIWQWNDCVACNEARLVCDRGRVAHLYLGASKGRAGSAIDRQRNRGMEWLAKRADITVKVDDCEVEV